VEVGVVLVLLFSWKKIAGELDGVGVGVEVVAGITVEIASPMRT
jgi:hypothetical protein